MVLGASADLVYFHPRMDGAGAIPPGECQVRTDFGSPGEVGQTGTTREHSSRTTFQSCARCLREFSLDSQGIRSPNYSKRSFGVVELIPFWRIDSYRDDEYSRVAVNLTAFWGGRGVASSSYCRSGDDYTSV